MYNQPFLQIDPIWYQNFINNKEIFQRFKQENDFKLENKESSPVQIEGSKALVSIKGPVFYRPNAFIKEFFDVADTAELIEIVRNLRENDKIKSVLFDIDSPGGETTKLNALADEVFELSKSKQTIALNSGTMASAAYRIGSQCSYIYQDDKYNMTGSIGTYVTLIDSSQAFEKEGLQVVHLSTGDLKGLPQSGIEIDKKQQEYIQSIVNTLQAGFNSEIERMRQDVDLSDGSEARSGKAFMLEDSIKLGLVDGMKSASEIFQMMDAQEKVRSIRSRI